MRTRPHTVAARLSEQELQDLHKNCWCFLKGLPSSKSDRIRGLLDYLTRRRQDLAFQVYVHRPVSDGPPIDGEGMLQLAGPRPGRLGRKSHLKGKSS